MADCTVRRCSLAIQLAINPLYQGPSWTCIQGPGQPGPILLARPETVKVVLAGGNATVSNSTGQLRGKASKR